MSIAAYDKLQLSLHAEDEYLQYDSGRNPVDHQLNLFTMCARSHLIT